MKRLFQKEPTIFRANKLFVDRSEPTCMINEKCAEIVAGELKKKYIVFYGYGGIGKTKFFSELKNRLIYPDSFYTVKVNLNVYEYNNVVSILLAIRRSLSFDAPQFDYAVVQYYKKCGLPFSELQDKFATVNSSVMEIVKDVSKEVAGSVIPGFSYIEKVMDLAPNVKSIFNRIKNDRIYKEIDELDQGELIKMMPIYLANAINGEDKKIILMFDDYDSMRNKLNGGSLCESCDEWVLTLLEKIEYGLFLFSSRERMSWVGHKKVSEHFAQYFIERLSDEDARYFLENIPIENEEIVKNIISLSKGIPIYLDMCVDLYVDFLKSEEEVFDLSNLDVSTITVRYLAHLSEAQNELVRILSNLKSFDLDIIWYIIKRDNLSIDTIQLNLLLEKCLFNKLDNNTYKLDASIRKHLLETNGDFITDNIFSLLLDYLSEEKETIGEATYSCFESLCMLISEKRRVLNQKQIEKLFKCTNNLLDFGYWSRLHELFTHYLPRETYAPLIKYVYVQKLKREGALAKAHLLAKELLSESKWFGCYQCSIELLENQISHLLGNYETAIKKYKQIYEYMEMLMLDISDKRTYILAKLKYADLLFLKGDFPGALMVLRGIDVSGNTDLTIELARIQGHIMRFNLKHDFSEQRYSYAYGICSGDLKGKGALLNNLADVNCIREPEEAIKYVKEALKINSLIHAKIEIGKGYATYSVAETRLGNYKEAKKLAQNAISIQRESGYLSGELFGYFALAYCHHFEKNTDGYSFAISKMEEIVNRIDMYRYVLYFAKSLSGAEQSDHGIKWIEPIEDKLGDLL